MPSLLGAGTAATACSCAVFGMMSRNNAPVCLSRVARNGGLEPRRIEHDSPAKVKLELPALVADGTESSDIEKDGTNSTLRSTTRAGRLLAPVRQVACTVPLPAIGHGVPFAERIARVPDSGTKSVRMERSLVTCDVQPLSARNRTTLGESVVTIDEKHD